MKNILIICAATCIFLAAASAQESGDVNFGIIGGTNLTFPGGGDIYDLKQEAKENNESNPFHLRAGMHAGLRIEYFPTDHVGFGTGLFYNQKGWVEKYDVSDPDDPEEDKYKIKLDYIEVPLLIVINLKGFHIYGGPAFSILVLDRAKYEYGYMDYSFQNPRYVVEEEKGSVASVGEYDVPKSFTGGFCFGIKGQLPKGVTLGGGLSFTAPVFPQGGEEGYNVNMTTMQISIGKVFTWKKKQKTETADAYSGELKNLQANYEHLAIEVEAISDNLSSVNQKINPVSSMNLKLDELTAAVTDMNEDISNLKTGSRGNTASDYSPAPQNNPSTSSRYEEEPSQPENTDDERLPVPCYVISCGVFANESAARGEVWKLQEKGLVADYYYIPDYDPYGKTQYRVFTGPYRSKAEAENMKPKVAAKVPGAWVLWVEGK